MRPIRLPALVLTAVLTVGSLSFGPVALAEDSDEEPVAKGPSPWLAGGLSLLMPGLGQFYAEERTRALLVFGGAVALVVGKIVIGAMIPPKDPSPAAQPPTQPRAALEAVDLIFSFALPTYWAWNVGDAVKLTAPASDPSASPSPTLPPGVPATPPILPPGGF